MSPFPSNAPHRPDASMALIMGLTQESWDSYRSASMRAGRSGADAAEEPSSPHRSARPRGLAVLTLTMLLGFGVSTSVLALRQPAAAPSPVKTDLVTRIQAQRAAAQDGAARIDRLRDELRRLQSSGLAGAGVQALSAGVERLEYQVGAVAVTGPGLTVTMDDAPAEARPARPPAGAGSTEEGTVLARDLQQIVNALWAAGAEAVDVNGNRLLATTSIRFAGRAVVVGFRPLTRPYVVSAIGPPELARRFTSGSAGEYLEALRRVYRIRAEVVEAGAVSVPAGPALSPRYARAVPSSPAGPATSAPPAGRATSVTPAISATPAMPAISATPAMPAISATPAMPAISATPASPGRPS